MTAARDDDNASNPKTLFNGANRPASLGQRLLVRIISGSLGEFVGPSVDDRMAINIVDTSHDALLKLVF